jgi:hypothetical protein
MQVTHVGHVYLLEHVDGDGHTEVRFVNKEPGDEQEGTTTQEVCRMLIDRTRYCNNCLPHRVNEEIIYHLRMVIALHEARALEQAVKKGEVDIEYSTVAENGHLMLAMTAPLANATVHLRAVTPEWESQKPVYLNERLGIKTPPASLTGHVSLSTGEELEGLTDRTGPRVATPEQEDQQETT